MPHLSFHPGFNGFILLIVAGVATWLVAVLYRRAFRSLEPYEWVQLYVLRMAAIVLVLLLLFRPVLSFQQQIKQKRSLVFLIDRSASMSISDDTGSGTRFDLARARLSEWHERLKRDFELRLVSFADSANVEEDVARLGSLEPNGQATSLSRALGEAAKVAPSSETEAVFLFSDGIHNSAGSPLQIVRRLGVQVNTIGVGNVLRDRSTYRDIRVTNLECPDQMAVDNRAQLTAYVDAVGLPGRVTKVVFEEDGRPIGEREIVLDDTEGLQEIAVEFVPTVKGLHTYTARVPAAAEEKIPENNQHFGSSLVVDSRIRVLYVEGTLRPEYGALVGRFLAKDPNIEFCALVQTRPNVFMQRSNIEGFMLDSIPDDAETMNSFDVFLVGDLDMSYLKPRQMELLAERVKDGAGLIMIGGYHSLGPGGYSGSPLEEVLPVFVGQRDIGQITEPFSMTLTPEGRRHPIFSNIASFFPSHGAEAEETGLPLLEGCVRIGGTKPGATVLAIHPTESLPSGTAAPVMAVQRVGDGRAAVFTGDTTRNWHQALRSLDRESPFLRFWGQTVRWLADRSEELTTEPGITVTTDKAYYEPDSKVTISVSIRGQGGEGLAGAKVLAKIRDPRAWDADLEMSPEAGPAGHYRLAYEPPAAGQYEIVVQAERDGQQLTSEKLMVHVGRPNLEFDQLDLDDKMLITIANETGGRYAHITTADRLIDRLQRTQQERLVTLEMAVAWPPLCWLLFVGVLTSEWLLRRRYQLR